MNGARSSEVRPSAATCLSWDSEATSGRHAVVRQRLWLPPNRGRADDGTRSSADRYAPGHSVCSALGSDQRTARDRQPMQRAIGSLSSKEVDPMTARGRQWTSSACLGVGPTRLGGEPMTARDRQADEDRIVIRWGASEASRRRQAIVSRRAQRLRPCASEALRWRQAIVSATGCCVQMMARDCQAEDAEL